MLALHLPKYSFKIKESEGKKMIFDRCRRKFVSCTPEEWVRQHLVEFLIREKNYPASLIVNEATVEINGMKKRCDTVVYNKKGTPVMIIEYKAPHVIISQSTFDQIAMYNFRLQVEYLIVSNGLNHYCCRIDYEKPGYTFLEEIPESIFE
jgi:predicted type IV restriction endonuclease